MVSHKIQKTGRCFFLYLPNQWITDNQLGKGDELELAFDDNNIIISYEGLNKPKKATFSINKTNPKVLSRVISSLFTVGFDEFELMLKQKLNTKSFNELKILINNLGLNMIDVNDECIKLNVNQNVSDIKKAGLDFLYKTLNLTRMLIHKQNKDIIDQQITSLYYFRFILLRSVYQHQQSLINLKIKPVEANFYTSLGANLPRLAYNIVKIIDKKFIEQTKEVLEKLLVIYEQSKIDKIITLGELIENLRVKVSDNKQTYFKRRVLRCLLNINQHLLESHLALKLS